MNTIEEIVSFEPQITKPEYGPEPSLGYVLEEFYLKHGIEPVKAKKCVKQYIDALKEWAK